jgi:hypothetical protein
LHHINRLVLHDLYILHNNHVLFGRSREGGELVVGFAAQGVDIGIYISIGQLTTHFQADTSVGAFQNVKY